MDVPLVTYTRGGFDESVHRGHVAVWRHGAGPVAAWGDPDAVILPRSSCKMIQALPLLRSGAAGAAGLGPRELALACASHVGGAMHVGPVTEWLAAIGASEADLRCGPQMPSDREERARLIREDTRPDQRHNNCSGKHTGFLTLSRHLGAGPDYVDPDHPVQRAVREAFEAATGEASPGHGIDGCSAPNFATPLAGLARAMAGFAAAEAESPEGRLRDAMRAHPALLSGTDRAVARLMRAAGGRTVVKSGAEGTYTAILPEAGLGIAVKIADGADRAAETVMAALLVRFGAVEAGHGDVAALVSGPLRNRAGLAVGTIRPAPALLAPAA